MEAIHRADDGTLSLELAATKFVFPITIEQGGEEYIGLFHMTPCAPSELAHLMAESSGQFHVEGRRRMILEPGAQTPFLELFDRHFLKISGIEGEPTVEEQKSWLARHERLKQRVIEEGYAGAEIVTSLNGGGPRAGLRLADLSVNRFKIAWRLWSEATGQVEKLIVTHALAPETRDDYRRYERATSRVETHTRKRVWKVLIDNQALIALYDDMVESLEGCVVRGIACSGSNKNEWVALVPYWQKMTVVHEIFTEGSAKNA